MVVEITILCPKLQFYVHEKANPEEAETQLVETEASSQTGLKNAYICVYICTCMYVYICIGILEVIPGPAVILVTIPLVSSKEQIMILKLF